MEFHWIFAGVLILCFILLFKFLRKTSKRCYVCRESVLSLDTLEESRRDAIVSILEQEDVNLDQLEICPKCSRIYDEGWLSKDWDMSDRYCECGGGLKTPWSIDPPILKTIMTGLPPQIVQSLVEETDREDVAKLLGGYQDMLYRHDRLPEGHALRVCEQCFRVYMWVPKGDALLFKCVYRNVKEVE